MYVEFNTQLKYFITYLSYFKVQIYNTMNVIQYVNYENE